MVYMHVVLLAAAGMSSSQSLPTPTGPPTVYGPSAPAPKTPPPTSVPWTPPPKRRRSPTTDTDSSPCSCFRLMTVLLFNTDWQKT